MGREQVMYPAALLVGEHLQRVLVALDAGARIAEHRAEGMIAIHVIDGCVRLRSGASTTELKAGALATVENEVEHALEAVERSGVLLSIAWTGHHTAR
ncbi:MAG TPA: hypothetical protein VLB44_23065 [Kofleriaceae bacterium]|nr:hypothetical protein [Kofleriaceae bacterium]